MRILPLALFFDALMGEAPDRLHPVCFLGKWAERCEAYFRSILPSKLFLAGRLATFAVLLPFTALAAGLVGLGALLGSGLSQVLAACVVYVCLAPRSLGEHATAVACALEKDDIAAARAAVARMVGRDVRHMDSFAVGRACVESVGENLVDGVLATIFWACVGESLFGAVGAAGLAALHRGANTLDAMWGKRNERYERFGTCAARLDDGLGWLPARLSLPIVAFSAFFVRQNARNALRVGWRDHAAHASPNSAWSEAAFAGALGLRLGGPATYGGLLRETPYLGDTTAPAQATAAHIRAAVNLMWASTLMCTFFGEVVVALCFFFDRM